MEIIGFIMIAIIVVVIIFANGMINERNLKKNYEEKLLTNYGKEPDRVYKDGEFEHINGFDKHHEEDFTLDTITWNDLDMDSLFKQMNYTKSSAGEEYLYHILKTPDIQKKDYTKYENQVSYFMTHEAERKTMQIALHEMGRTGKYSIYDYLNNLDTLGDRSNKKDIFVDLLFIPAIALMFYSIGYGIVLLFVLILYNLVTYFREKGEIDPYITCFAYVFRVIRGVKTINAKTFDILKEEQETLSRLEKQFTRFKRFSSLIMSKSRMTGNPTEIGVDYLRMFFHIDIIKFNSMLHEVKKHWNDIDEILRVVGYLDTILAVGEYRTHLVTYCIPQFMDKQYDAKNIYHPLLKEPVKNNIQIKKSILLTGSNASGKSTFLKTVAVNAILAQSIHTVAAESYQADYYRIYTSLSLKDNIFDGDSYYMAEIKSIKRIMDAAKNSEVPILGFVDEVLRGTNTIERIAASSIILKSMSKANGYMLAATHDVELTEILKDIYDNYHFDEIIKDNDIFFPYMIKKGKALSKNAILLLEMMGYDRDIVANANKMAAQFEKTGIWS